MCPLHCWQDGNLTGFVGECLHVFNKNASSAAVKPYFQTEEVSLVVSREKLFGYPFFFFPPSRCLVYVCFDVRASWT